MQDSTFPYVEKNENSRFFQLVKRIKIACKLIANPKAIVIINNHVSAFEIPPKEVCETLYKRSMEINNHLLQEENITRVINGLVYN